MKFINSDDDLKPVAVSLGVIDHTVLGVSESLVSFDHGIDLLLANLQEILRKKTKTSHNC